MNDDFVLNLLYFLVALCIMFKVSWLARMTGHISGWQIQGFRLSAAAVATIVMSKALGRFAGADAAALADVVRELSFCTLLGFGIAVLKARTGHW